MRFLLTVIMSSRRYQSDLDICTEFADSECNYTHERMNEVLIFKLVNSTTHFPSRVLLCKYSVRLESALYHQVHMYLKPHLIMRDLRA